MVNYRDRIYRYLLSGILVLVFQICSAQHSNQVFRQLTVEDGLSHNWVRTILKDRDGFMWFGTFNGLNKYDGNHFTIYQTRSGSGLSDNVIECLAEDASGNIWIGTFSGGLNKFDKRTEAFVAFVHDPGNAQSVSGNRVYAVYAEGDSLLWIGTDAGLDVFNQGTGRFTHFQHDPDNEESLAPGLVSCIYPDHHGQLWIGAEGGVSILNRNSKTFSRITADPENANSLSQNYVKSIYEDKYGNVWLGSWGGGIDQYVPATQTFHHHQQSSASGLTNNSVLSVSGDGENLIYIATEGGGLNVLDIQQQVINAFLPDISDARSINSNSVHTLYYDRESSLLWAGTYNGGVNYFSKWDKPFTLYQAKPHGLNNHHVTSITRDKSGRFFIGTDGGGVNILDEKSGQFTYVTERDGLQSDAVLSLLCDDQNNIWIGSYNGGLDLIRGSDNRLRHFRHDPSDSSSLSGVHVSAIYQDRRGQLWVGTMTDGLNLYNEASGDFTHFRHNPADSQSIGDNFIYGIYEDRLGRMLVQTGGGLEVFDYKSGKFSRFAPAVTTDFGVPIALCEDSHGNLWIGSQEKGLFRVDRTGAEVKGYTIEDGLPGNSISAILEDESGNLWISTHRGLCKFEGGVLNPDRVRIHVFTKEDGLQGSEFKRGAYLKTADNRLVFGGQNGFNIFDPSKIKQNPVAPPVRITGFKVFNKDVDFTKDDVLQLPITETEELRLPHGLSVFSLEFSALSYLLTEKNQYAYMLEGFEEAWNYVGTQRSATYSNLDPGTYTFLVKASNNDGIWNETPARLKITIVPPWWATTWFKIVVALGMIALIISYLRLRMYHLRKAKDELARKVELGTADLKHANEIINERQAEILRHNEALMMKNRELESHTNEIRRMAEEIKELTEAKTMFFSNVSHELQYPLNDIIRQAEELIAFNNVKEDSLGDKHHAIHQNATRLVRMINQLLDMSKAVAGTLAYHPELSDVIDVVQRTVAEFREAAQQKNIDFKFECDIPKLHMWFDPEKLAKALSKLISNAFISVGESGAATVTVKLLELLVDMPEQRRIGISVQDNGNGIAPDQLEKIRNLFQKENMRTFPGTGIGLSYVKELIDLHHGVLQVESTLGQGATFRMIIPVVKEMPEASHGRMAVRDPESQMEIGRFIDEVEDIREGFQKPSILIIDGEGERGMQKWSRLQSFYQVTLINNGADGLNEALQHLPDLIICDMHLPDNTGQEVCSRLKSDEHTSHIPVIAMSSRNEAEVHTTLLDADDTITTPFQADLLELKIKNIFFTRDKLKEMFLRGAMSQTELASMNAGDAKFIRKAAAVVRENLRNSEFGVNEFSVHFGMSRRNVLRKMKAVTGLSINEYIRNTRLKEAFTLLQNGELNVSEVAYTVGFTDPKYFSNCFKKLYGKSPSEVRSVTSA